LTYIPKPVDTSGVCLTNDLDELVEYLAKNTHENWANERIKQGWRYGSQRNDINKEHPCLVAYEQLPESEKDHDRTIVKELLRTILLRGFQIEKAAGNG
jgi:ryanodine receptor 2